MPKIEHSPHGNGIEVRAYKGRDQHHALSFKETEYDGITYIAPSWNEMGDVTFLVSQAILESEQKYDRIVALAKGGWTWARTLADHLHMKQLSSIGLQLYNGINETLDKPQIVAPLAVPIVGENILLFDEVIDSGVSAQKAHRYLIELGAASVDTATLCYKKELSSFIPDYWGFTTSAWVMFPHEIRESVELAGAKWLTNGVPPDEIHRRFEIIGLPMNQVIYFWNRFLTDNLHEVYLSE